MVESQDAYPVEQAPIVLEAQELSKSFGRRTVLQSATFTVRRGETIGLVGPHGAGKTTLVKLLLGFLAPSHGRVSWLPGPGRPSGKPTVGFLPQKPRFPHMLTPRSFLQYCASFSGISGRERSGNVAEVLSAVGLEGVARRPIGRLSPIEQRLVGVGQALLARPELVVLDAATEGLTFEEGQSLLAMVCLLREEAHTLLLSARSAQELGVFCQRMLVVEDGKVTETSVAEAKGVDFAGVGGTLWITLDAVPPTLIEFLVALGCQFEAGGNTLVLDAVSPSIEREVLMQLLQAGRRIVELRRGPMEAGRPGRLEHPGGGL